ncbi:hypothetical protein JCM14076_00070 [Methylosoma difficile]
MIDMRGIFSHPDYEDTLNEFKNSACRWSIFQHLHKRVSNNKCPVCEVELVEIQNHDYSATIDHFRPKAAGMYPHLKCEPKNYILMCSLCNNRYKKAKFPLVDESKRATGAINLEDTKEEEPLLFNPAEEDPLYFFELAFVQTEVGNILELKKNKTILEDSYDYLRCEEMIKLFGLGYFNEDIHPNDKTKSLRLDVLTAHYEIFIQLAKAINDGDRKSIFLILSNKNRKQMLEKYGFFQFLMKKQFSVR